MGSIVPDDTDFREHVAQLKILHVERDNRLPRAWNIVAKLISEFCGWDAVKNMILGPICKTHLLSTTSTPPWAYADEVSRPMASSHAANLRVIIIYQPSQNHFSR